MRFLFLFIFCIIGATTNKGLAESQKESQQEFHQDELVVSAIGTAIPLNQTGAVVNLITAEDLERIQARDLGDVLRGTGINVPQSGGVGTMSNIFLRGLPGRYSTLISDGISLYDPGANQVLWHDIMSDGIGRIEIVRGSHALLYGANAVAGVVVAQTAIGGARQTRLGVEGGSFASNRVHISGQGALGKTDYGYSFTRFETGGISAVDEAAGNHEQDGHRNHQLRWRSQSQLNDAWRFDVSLFNTFGTTEYDSGFPLADADYHQTFHHRAARGALLYERARSSHEVAVQYYDSDREDFAFSTSENKAQQITAHYNGKARLENAQFTWGLEHNDNRHESGFFAAREVENRAAYGLVHLTPKQNAQQIWAITLGARVDDHALFGSHSTWRAAFAYSPIERLTLRALVATGYRAPTLFELFSTSFGNPNLQPEESRSQEIGLDVRLSRALNASITFFDIRIDDLIGFDPQSFRSIQTAGRTKAQGAEASLKGDWQNLTLRANLHYNDSKQADGTPSLRVPRWQANLALDYQLNDAWQIGTSIGATYDTRDVGQVRLDESFLMQIRTRWQFHKNIALHARVENLFDERYQRVNGYGTFGRAAYLGVSARF